MNLSIQTNLLKEDELDYCLSDYLYEPRKEGELTSVFVKLQDCKKYYLQSGPGRMGDQHKKLNGLTQISISKEAAERLSNEGVHVYSYHDELLVASEDSSETLKSKWDALNVSVLQKVVMNTKTSKKIYASGSIIDEGPSKGDRVLTYRPDYLMPSILCLAFPKTLSTDLVTWQQLKDAVDEGNEHIFFFGEQDIKDVEYLLKAGHLRLEDIHPTHPIVWTTLSTGYPYSVFAHDFSAEGFDRKVIASKEQPIACAGGIRHNRDYAFIPE